MGTPTSTDTRYRQCELTRTSDGTTRRLTSWIPKQFAAVGRTLRLRSEETGEWTDGWKVVKVHGRTRSQWSIDVARQICAGYRRLKQGLPLYVRDLFDSCW